MSEEIVNSLENLKTFVLEAKSLIDSKDERIKELEEKCVNLEDDYNNLKKVSLVTSLSRQLDSKNNEIEILQKQLHKAKFDLVTVKEDSKKLSKNTSKSVTTLEEDSDEDSLEEGYKMIEYEDLKLLKNLETRKLYFIVNGKKGKYAGKESKKGKIKLK